MNCHTIIDCVSCVTNKCIFAWLANDTGLCVVRRAELNGLKMKAVIKDGMDDLCPYFFSTTTAATKTDSVSAGEIGAIIGECNLL